MPPYASPFEIKITNSIGTWTSDFGARSQAVTNNTFPSLSDWYSYDFTAGYPGGYGPLDPELFATSSNDTLNTNIIQQLRYDRGPATFDVALNDLPAGVAPLSWMQQRLFAAAKGLIGTHYQHIHLPGFNPANVTPSNNYSWSPVSDTPIIADITGVNPRHHQHSRQSRHQLRNIPASQNPYLVQKEHVLMQNSTNPPEDMLGNFSGDPSPYNFSIQSATPGSVKGPGGNYPLSFTTQYSGAAYAYRSAPLATLSKLNTLYKDGTYKFTAGQTLLLTNSIYPNTSNPPQITLVNMETPIWNTQG